METKDFKFNLEDTDEDKGTFTGVASVFDAVDSYNEVVLKGAFKKTIRENDGKFPLNWFHKLTEPLGMIYPKEDQMQLKVKGVLNLDVQSAREKRSLMKQGAVTGLSIGFQTIKDEWDDKKKIRKLKEIKLYEISLITRNIQACPGAEIGDVKANLEPKSLEEILERILSIKAIENLSSERLELIIKSITHLETLREGRESLPIGTLEPTPKPSKGVRTPIYEALERQSKPERHLFGPIYKDLENLIKEKSWK